MAKTYLCVKSQFIEHSHKMHSGPAEGKKNDGEFQASDLKLCSFITIRRCSWCRKTTLRMINEISFSIGFVIKYYASMQIEYKCSALFIFKVNLLNWRTRGVELSFTFFTS